MTGPADTMVDGSGTVASGGTVSALTPSQLSLLRVMATGITYQQAATELCISKYTVRNHLSEAYRRLNVTNLVGAYARLGWIAIPIA